MRYLNLWNRDSEYGLSSDPPPALALTRLVQHPIEAALLANKKLLIGQCRHDLLWHHCGVNRLVAGRQDSLGLLLAEPLGDMTITDITAIGVVPITQEGLPSALEGAQANAD